MKILRDKEKKEKTAEEKELDDYKKAKNTGLAAMGTGALFYGSSRLGEKFNNSPKIKATKGTDHDLTIDPKHNKIAKISGLALGIGGGILHGISAVKYRKLKKKLEKEKEENDNSEKKD